MFGLQVRERGVVARTVDCAVTRCSGCDRVLSDSWMAPGGSNPEGPSL